MTCRVCRKRDVSTRRVMRLTPGSYNRACREHTANICEECIDSELKEAGGMSLSPDRFLVRSLQRAVAQRTHLYGGLSFPNLLDTRVTSWCGEATYIVVPQFPRAPWLVDAAPTCPKCAAFEARRAP